MTDQETITALSRLPHKTLETMRLALNVLWHTDPYGKDETAKLVGLINKAIESKQVDYFHGFEIVEDQLGV